MLAQSPLSRRAVTSIIASVTRAASFIPRTCHTPHYSAWLLRFAPSRSICPSESSKASHDKACPISQSDNISSVSAPSHNVSERRNLNNPRLNAVQSGDVQRPDHPRTAGIDSHKALPEPGAKWRSSARCHLISTHRCHQVYSAYFLRFLS